MSASPKPDAQTRTNRSGFVMLEITPASRTRSRMTLAQVDMSAEFAGELKCFLFAELTERGASHGGTDVRSKLGISTQLFSPA